MAFYHMQMQQENIDTGQYQVTVSDRLNNRPIENARVRISYTGAPDSTIEEVTTDSSGRTPVIELKTPPLEYSMEPVEQQPYSEYTIQIEAEGFEPKEIAGSQVLADTLSRQPTTLNVMESGETFQRIVIPPHTLFYEYPPKIEEAEIKPINENGEIVLSKVVVPEYIVVHDGPVNDSAAGNYYVRYKDYIKNVASSEIYATWPKETLLANILAIQSITLNRVYTEWYRNRGYDFTITSSTAYDQKFIPGRNIFESISQAVDTIFSNYISRPNITQPLFTQYCDGKRVSCPRWMRQWESKTLGDQGYSAIEILRRFYGDSVFINSSEEISGIPASWPGYDLTIGSTGEKVRQLQNQLNTISKGYPLIPKIAADGVYGEDTANAVKIFQKVFHLPQTGVVDYPTWYRISDIYVGVSRIAELS